MSTPARAAHSDPYGNGPMPQVTATNGLFPIVVKSLTGTLTPLLVTAQHTVGHIKELYEIPTAIPPDEQRFIFAGKRLEDGKSMQDYNIQAHSTLHVVLRLRGGIGSGPTRPLLFDLTAPKPPLT